VVEVQEVLRAWLSGAGARRAAERGGVNVKTARRYIAAAVAAGLVRGGGEGQLSGELLGAVLGAVRPARPDGHGDSWEQLVPLEERIRGWVKGGVTVTKIGELLAREGADVPYRTLHRFAVECCGFTGGRGGVTVRVDDGEPGGELQVDFGDLGMIPDEGRRRLLRALVFTAVFSRYCFVYLTFSQTTEEVIAGCEQAWAFFGGVFKIIVPDNLKPVVIRADAVNPVWNRSWLEYSQARGFHTDPARVRSPQDKGRVEAGVKFVQGSFFAGEQFTDLADARARVLAWCTQRAGQRVHGTTRQRPAEVFAQAEQGALLPAPAERYQVPRWAQVKVHRDCHLRVGSALYSVPHALVGQQVTARADEQLVRVYHQDKLIKTHPRQGPGGRSTDAGDFPAGTDVYARRDITKLAAQAAAHGRHIGIYAGHILDTPLPWTRMRAVYALIGLARSYGDAVVDDACATALELDVVNVGKIKSMVEKGTGKHAAAEAGRHAQAAAAAGKARFARDAREFATATGAVLHVLDGGTPPEPGQAASSP
jgi:transposase